MTAKPKIVRLRRPKVSPDSRFIETLVYLLDLARSGKAHGYAMVFLVGDDKACKLVEGSDALTEHDTNALLGAMRRMELGFIRRHFPED